MRPVPTSSPRQLCPQALVRLEPGHRAPAELDLPVVAAANPYDRQIEHLNRQIGAVFPRQAMKDASGASQMDAKTQITSLHGTSMLDAAQFPVESNICLSLPRGPGSENDRRSMPPSGRRSTCSARRLWPRPRRRAREATRPTRFSLRRAASWVHAVRAAGRPGRAGARGRLYRRWITERRRRGVRPQPGAVRWHRKPVRVRPA